MYNKIKRIYNLQSKYTYYLLKLIYNPFYLFQPIIEKLFNEDLRDPFRLVHKESSEQ